MMTALPTLQSPSPMTRSPPTRNSVGCVGSVALRTQYPVEGGRALELLKNQWVLACKARETSSEKHVLLPFPFRLQGLLLARHGLCDITS